MKSPIEKFSTVFLFAGLFLFLGATLSLGLIPALMVDKIHPRQGLPEEVPVEFQGEYATVDLYQEALLAGRDVYVAEGCWHCHSQYVRPVSNENLMYGPVSTPGEFNTVLHLPQLLGTRRVGPDLSREAGVRTNDWHYAHLYSPQSVVPDSVMPNYDWLFTKNKDGQVVPNKKATALVAYLQSLGRQVKDRVDRAALYDDYIMPPVEESKTSTNTNTEEGWGG
jgi:cbb3-type cytochrome c oxidase subunit II